MKYTKLNKQLVNLRVLLEHVSENETGQVTEKGAQLTMRLKTLFTISTNKNCAPSLLIEHLCVAKSNLAILCRGLIEEGLIVSEKNENDKRNIYYNITEKGNKELDLYYESLEKQVLDNINLKDVKLIERKIDELTQLLIKSTTKKKS